MKRNHHNPISWLLASSLLIGGAAWAAQPVTITNAGFEDPVLANGVYSAGAVPGWSAFNGGNIGVLNPADSDLTGGNAPEGQNVALVTSSANQDGLSQSLTSTFQADADYSLTVKIANPKATTGFPGYRVQLLADGTVLAEDDNSQTVAQDAVVTSTVNYTYDSGDAGLVGQPLEIRLLSQGLATSQEIAFDDVQLTVTLLNPVAVPGGPYAVPEGGSLSLDGSGSLPSDGEFITNWDWDLDNDGDFGEAISGATPASIPYATLTGAPPAGFGMVEGINTIKLRVTDSSAKTSTVEGTVALLPPVGTITVDGTAFWNRTESPVTGTFNASASDKLVVILTGEHGFNNDQGTVSSVTYDGAALTPVIQRNAQVAGTDTVYNHIWILDDPATVHVSGVIVANVVTRGNITVFGLSGTVPGAGATAISANNTRAVDLTTTAFNSIVIASFGMGGAGNTADTNNVTVDPPLTFVSAQRYGNNWDGHVTGYAQVPTPGTGTYSFTGGNVNGAYVIAAEFQAAPLDEIPPTLAPADIVDNQSGGPVSEGNPVIYTLTFSENMAPSSITADDFENAGSSAITINSVTVIGKVVTVSLTPGAGTLQLQVKAGAEITDKSGNLLDTTSAIADDTIITVEVDITPPVVETLSPANGATGTTTAPILVATFSEKIVKGTGNIEVRRTSDDSLVNTIDVTSGAVTVSGVEASISLGVVLDSLVGYYVLVAPGAFTDLVGNAFAGITLKTVWSFTTGEFGLIGVTAAGQFFPALFEEYGGQSWILIGRGREGWQFDTDGQGTPGEVGLNLKDPAGFAPKALSDAIVNDLLSQAGKSFPNDVVIRVMRASTTDGTGEYQELRYTNFTGFPNGNTQFTFFFDDANKFANVQRVNAPAGLPGASIGTGNATIRDHQAGGNNANRVFTWAWGGHNNQKGFSMGQTVEGVDNNNPNTFLWEFATENHAIPYSEVWLQLEVPGGGGNNFSDWIAGFPGAAGDPSFDGDPDGDGISNGIENYFGTDPSVFSVGIHGVELTGNTVSFSHPLNATPADDVSAAYVWSEDLQTWYADGGDNGSGTTVDFAQGTPSGGMVDVTATITGPVPAKLFVAVKVTQDAP